MHITLRHLRIFEAVSRCGSFSRAAAELHLTQPAVSMRMKQLEEHIGLPLIGQVGKRMFLTEAGRALQGHARDMASRRADLNAAMDQFRGLERGLLRLAVVSTAHYFLPPLIADFNRPPPAVGVGLRVANREFVLSALADNSTDLAIVGGPPDSLDVVAQHFMDNPLVVIVAPAHRPVALEAMPLQSLAEDRLVVREPGSGTRAAMERHFASHGVACRGGVRVRHQRSFEAGVASRAGSGRGVGADHRIRTVGRLPGGSASRRPSHRPTLVRAARHAQASVRRCADLSRDAARARPVDLAGSCPERPRAASVRRIEAQPRRPASRSCRA